MRTSLKLDPVLGQKRRRRRFGGTVIQDRSRLLAEWGGHLPAGDTPAVRLPTHRPSHRRSESHSPLAPDDGQVVLTLGDTSAVVAVVPDEPESPTPQPQAEPVVRTTQAIEPEETADRLRRWKESRQAVAEMIALLDDCETAVEESEAQPVVMHFEPDQSAAEPVVEPAPKLIVHPRPVEVRESFSWRRMFISAAVSGGLGSAALLIIYMISR